MSYDWKLVPGQYSEKYDTTISASAEYVSKDFGDDIQGDGSAESPFASVTQSLAIIQGVFQNELFGPNLYCYTDGFALLIASANNNMPTRAMYGGEINFSGGWACWNFFKNVVKNTEDVYLVPTTNGNNSLIIKPGETNPSSQALKNFDRCTLVGDYHKVQDLTNSIIASTKIHFNNGNFTNCLISNQNNPVFIFNGEPSYTAATGATDADKLANLRARAVTAYGGVAADHFVDCVFGDPQFQNPNLGDYTLKPGSVAATMNPEGSYVGCYKETIAFHPNASANTSDWYHEDGTKTKNIAVGSELAVVDPQIDGYANSKPKDIGQVRELGRIIAQIENDFVNGAFLKNNQHFNPAVALSSADPLVVGQAYYVASGYADTNGTTYVENTRFTAQSTSFAGTGILHPAFPNYMRHGIAIRYSKGGPLIYPGTNLNAQTYYMVENDNVTYNGQSRSPGDFIHTGESGVLNFTGLGAMQEVFAMDYSVAPSSGSLFERESKITGVYEGDTVLGNFEAANAEPNFDHSREKEVFARFIQICIVYKSTGNLGYQNEA